MATVLVVAPHPDDETIGCGGTLLRHGDLGDAVHWLIATTPAPGCGPTADDLAAAASAFGFRQTHELELPETRLDALPLTDLIQRIGAVVRAVSPEIVYLPYRGDAHSDHRVVFDAAVACTKAFRYPSVRQVLVYETLSETDYALNPDRNGFAPNLFVDISAQLERKLAILRLYPSEIAPPPFPRSEEAVRALAVVRGAACGRHAAEAFMLLREIR